MNLSLEEAIAGNYYALKLIQNFISDNHVKRLTKSYEHYLRQSVNYYFFDPQCNYCPLIWMLYSRQDNKKIKQLHES